VLKSLRLYKGTTGYITTTHYSVNAVGHYYTTECYGATCRYSLSVFATVCYGQNRSLLMQRAGGIRDGAGDGSRAVLTTLTVGDCDGAWIDGRWYVPDTTGKFS